MMFFSTALNLINPSAKILIFSKTISQIVFQVKVDLWSGWQQKGCPDRSCCDLRGVEIAKIGGEPVS